MREDFLVQVIVLGVMLGLIGYLAALWLGPDDPAHYIHALTVPITVILVVIAGTLLGAMLPLVFERIGWDPALMSTPFIAGIIDVNRPFFGDWTNYQIDEDPIYNGVDYLQYNRIGKEVILERIEE